MLSSMLGRAEAGTQCHQLSSQVALARLCGGKASRHWHGCDGKSGESPVGGPVAGTHSDGDVALLGIGEEVLTALELVVELGLQPTDPVQAPGVNMAENCEAADKGRTGHAKKSAVKSQCEQGPRAVWDGRRAYDPPGDDALEAGLESVGAQLEANLL